MTAARPARLTLCTVCRQPDTDTIIGIGPDGHPAEVCRNRVGCDRPVPAPRRGMSLGDRIVTTLIGTSILLWAVSMPAMLWTGYRPQWAGMFGVSVIFLVSGTFWLIVGNRVVEVCRAGWAMVPKRPVTVRSVQQKGPEVVTEHEAVGRLGMGNRPDAQTASPPPSAATTGRTPRRYRAAFQRLAAAVRENHLDR